MGKSLYHGMLKEEGQVGVSSTLNPLFVSPDYTLKYNEGTLIDVGMHMGVNAFRDFIDMPTTITTGIKDVYYVNSTSGSLNITIKSVSGRTDYTIGNISQYISAGKSKLYCLPVTEGIISPIKFTNSAATFSLSGEFTPAHDNPDIIIPYPTYTDNKLVSCYGLGAKIYQFEVPEDTYGKSDLSFTMTHINGTDGKISWSLVNVGTGASLKSGYSSSQITISVPKIPIGTYQLKIEPLSPTMTSPEYAEMRIDITLTIPEFGPVDNTNDTYKTATLIKTGSNNAVNGWVGNIGNAVDTSDWYKYTTTTTGRVYAYVTATNKVNATMYTATGSEAPVAKSIWEVSEGTNSRNIRVSTAGTIVYVQIEPISDESKYSIYLQLG